VRCAAAAAAGDRPAALILLPGAVPATAHQRPEQPRLGAGLASPGVLDGRVALAAADRFNTRGAADGRSGIRLPARLVAGRTLHRVRVHTGAGDGAVAARAGIGSHAAADSHGCGQRRAALVSRRRTDRLRVDGLPPALPRVCRRLSRRRARRAGASHGREPEPAAALLLQRLRPRDQPDLDTRRQVDRVRLQSRPHPRHRGLLARRRRRGRRAGRAAL